MKRELSFASDPQSVPTDSLGRTRASSQLSIDDSIEQSNGLPMKLPESNGSVDGSQVTNARAVQCNGFAVYRRNKRFKTAKSNGGAVILEESNGGCVTAVVIEEKTKEGVEYGVVELVVTEEVENGGEVIAEVKNEVVEVSEEVKIEAPRRFTRSALKPKEERMVVVEGLESGVSEELRDGEVLDAEAMENADGSEFGTPGMFETKMSKKIVIQGRPTTVRELFATGLLDGYPVFYNGGSKATALRGIIKGIGILCYCNLCRGSRVLPICKFEIHACKSYRRASQYICLENGKSLLEVVKACRTSSIQNLEEKIKSVIGPLSVNESSICQSCTGSFFAPFMVDGGQYCYPCMDDIKSSCGLTPIAGVESRRSKAALGLESASNAKMQFSSQQNYQGKTRRKSSSVVTPISSGCIPLRISTDKKSQLKMTKKSLGEALAPKSSRSASAYISYKNKSHGKIVKKKTVSVSVPRPSKSSSLCLSPQNKSQWKITKKDQRLHKIVFEEGGLPDGSELAYYSRGKKLLEGYKRGSGIFCCCCNSEVSPSQFEAHAGWASRRKPYGYIYTSNGVSLHELAVSLLKGRRQLATDNDDLCIICADGGSLVLCDGCPRAFHKECASLSNVPRGKWYCKYCVNMFQRERFVEHNANALAAGRVSGVDPIEEITKRCIRIVRNPEEAEVIACVLCRGYDFSKSGFGPRTVILCDQCEKEYHVGCLKKNKMADLKELPKGKWFCCVECKRIFSALQNLLISGAEKLTDSLLTVVRKKQADLNLETTINFDVRWRLLNGKIASRENRLLLSEAVAIFHDSFDPIVDFATGRDFIPSMVYGRNIRGQDFGGMYCAILTVNSTIVSVGILRIFGQDMAELPLVATRKGSQGKGYFQLLFSCIEKLLAFLNVRSFVLPAAEEAESIWTEKFGFNKIPPEQLRNYRKICWQMLTFEGTSMLEKMVPQCRIIKQDSMDEPVV